MGDYVDDMIDRVFGFHSPPQRRKTFQSGSGRYKWRTSGGRVLDMHDMSTEHLENALRFTNDPNKTQDIKEILAERKLPPVLF